MSSDNNIINYIDSPVSTLSFRAASKTKKKSGNDGQTRRQKYFSLTGTKYSCKKYIEDPTNTMAESLEPFEDLLRTNDAPSESELTQIRIVLLQSERALALLESERHETQVLYEGLTLRQLHLRERINACRGIISPLRRLPSELIAAIFRSFPVEILDSKSLREATSSLCQVCSRWREIALSMPILWSSLDIYFHNDDDRLVRQREFIQMWLGRAKPSPLSISIHSVDIVPFDAILEQFEEYLPSIRELRVSAFAVKPPLPKDNALLVMPLLEILSLKTDEFIRTSDNLVFDTPHLRKVILEDRAGEIELETFVLPWQQLDSLALQGVACSPDLLHCLRRLEVATECSLSLARPYFQDIVLSPFDSAIIPKVRVLKIDFYTMQNLRLLSFITLPSLTHLEIRLDSLEPPPWLQEKLLPFLHRSYAILETLVLHSPEFNSADLEVLLRGIPSLQRLDLLCEIPNSFFHYMTASANNTDPVLPFLARLRIKICPSNLNLLASLVESRWWPDPKVATENGVSRIFLVTLLGSLGSRGSPLPCSALDRLQQCVKEGMTLFLSPEDDYICV